MSEHLLSMNKIIAIETLELCSPYAWILSKLILKQLHPLSSTQERHLWFQASDAETFYAIEQD